MPNAHNIEIKTAGVWESVDTAETLDDALLLAASYCETIREEWVRIITPDGKTL